MPFFKNLRRRSKATFTLTPSAASLNPNDDVFPDKLSSNLDSPTASLHSSPISFFKSNSIDLPSPHLPILPKLKTNGYATQVAPPQRPVPIGSPSTPRGSTTNGSLLSPTNSGRGPAPAPLYAPRVFSISDNSWVHQKILLIYGQIGDARQHSMDGNLTVYHPQDSFPPTTWPVYESHFKALVHLVPGPNKLRLEFSPSRIQNPMSHSSWLGRETVWILQYGNSEWLLICGSRLLGNRCIVTSSEGAVSDLKRSGRLEH
ncbi:zinc metalloproteinase [Histoplasma capsulatum]|uniref:Zinc metalloproteinase n=1 Tax=Ajellomyces capsulatus TaxID=5037 RepID=A0A8A1M1R0_AJECA|nr:zinc metalloproteinase [Histoplasma capsulatum]